MVKKNILPIINQNSIGDCCYRDEIRGDNGRVFEKGTYVFYFKTNNPKILGGWDIYSESCSLDVFDLSYDYAIENKNCLGIILKINSPGGSATQSKIIFDEINKIRSTSDKKIYAVIEDVGASGGYYIAASAEKIFSSSSSIVGSIGVRLDSYNIKRLMDKIGIKSQVLSSGKDKTILDPFADLSDDHKIHLQNLLSNIHNQFISDIMLSRGTKIDKDAFTGLFWTGSAAIKIGLIDELLSIYDVSEKFFNNNNLVTYNKERDILKEIFNTNISLPYDLFGIRY